MTLLALYIKKYFIFIRIGTLYIKMDIQSMSTYPLPPPPWNIIYAPESSVSMCGMSFIFSKKYSKYLSDI